MTTTISDVYITQSKVDECELPPRLFGKGLRSFAFVQDSAEFDLEVYCKKSETRS